jgi:glycosyltransferase involved in cell wall biosynthesis
VPNFESPTYDRDYAPAFGPRVRPLGAYRHDGLTVHRLPHRMIAGYPALLGLRALVADFQPDIVQTDFAVCWQSMRLAAYRSFLDFRLFTAAHQAAELAYDTRGRAARYGIALELKRLTRFIPGRLISYATEKCYAVTADAARTADRLYGVEREKIVTSPLGYEARWFHLPDTASEADVRIKVRQKLCFADEEIVCVYTGRFNEFKNPVLLAQAVGRLRSEGLPFRGLFVGGGDQADELAASEGCVVEGFVPADTLARFYWAADIAVWPRSYSASQVEAAACGLPVVMTDKSEKLELRDVVVPYSELDLESLVEVLRALSARSAREAKGLAGARMVAASLSWDAVASSRAEDYLLSEK